MHVIKMATTVSTSIVPVLNCGQVLGYDGELLALVLLVLMVNAKSS